MISFGQEELNLNVLSIKFGQLSKSEEKKVKHLNTVALN